MGMHILEVGMVSSDKNQSIGIDPDHTTTTYGTRVKQEPVDPEKGVSDELSLLYVDHVVKEEMVIGPEELQQSQSEIFTEVSTIEKSLSLRTDWLKNSSEVCSAKLALVHSCTTCQKQFIQRSDLDNHKCCNKPFSCSICRKMFTFRDSLVKHKRIHTIKTPYSCSTCGKQFLHRDSFLKHERIHRIKPFSCKTCGKQFYYSDCLVKHERVHSGEKPYECSNCPKRFSQRCSLIIHERTHSGEKPFSCSICTKNLTSRTGLVRHERTHIRERPLYSCSTCRKQLSSRSSLVRHERVHIGEKPFLWKQEIFNSVSLGAYQENLRNEKPR